jgi:hypothetical protein
MKKTFLSGIAVLVFAGSQSFAGSLTPPEIENVVAPVAPVAIADRASAGLSSNAQMGIIILITLAAVAGARR